MSVDRAAILRKALENPEIEAKRLEGLRRAWDRNRDKLRETLRESTSTPEAIEAQRAGCKASWADPEVRARREESIRRVAADPAVRAKRAEGMRRYHAEQRAVRARREQAKALVIDAGLPALRETVEYVDRMLERGAPVEVIVGSLRRAA